MRKSIEHTDFKSRNTGSYLKSQNSAIILQFTRFDLSAMLRINSERNLFKAVKDFSVISFLRNDNLFLQVCPGFLP